MKRNQIVTLIFILISITTFSQACGGKIISFKVFTEKSDANLDVLLHYVSKEKVDSIAGLDTDYKNWSKNKNLGDGVILNSDLGDSILKTKGNKFWNTKIENNIVKVVTPELSIALALIKLTYNDDSIYIITYGGNCVSGQNAVIWDSNPRTVQIDDRVELGELELENFPLKVEGAEFKINDIDCKWEYLVQPIINDNKHLKIIWQKLTAISENRVLLNTNNWVENNNPYYAKPTLEDLKKKESYNLECVDINHDDYCDFQIVTERAAAGANINYRTYLFNSNKKRFEYSELFSDYNIKYNSEKNRISSFMKSGHGNYYYVFKNLKSNKEELEFSEYVNFHLDSIIYKKVVDDAIVKKRKIILSDDEDPWNFENLLERNKKNASEK
jgi:hypothetical protein